MRRVIQHVHKSAYQERRRLEALERQKFVTANVTFVVVVMVVVLLVVVCPTRASGVIAFAQDQCPYDVVQDGHSYDEGL
jgi:hypothetical protein